MAFTGRKSGAALCRAHQFLRAPCPHNANGSKLLQRDCKDLDASLALWIAIPEDGQPNEGSKWIPTTKSGITNPAPPTLGVSARETDQTAAPSPPSASTEPRAGAPAKLATCRTSARHHRHAHRRRDCRPLAVVSRAAAAAHHPGRGRRHPHRYRGARRRQGRKAPGRARR